MDKRTLKWNWDTSYTKVNTQMFSFVHPSRVACPSLLVYNDTLAKELDLNLTEEEKIGVLSGNEVPLNSSPLAQAYAGHQFGHFNILGDGRAILLGEHLTLNEERFDIQLKGAGRTPYSRGGDGRATISAMLREYLISEAMHGLGIPTTRSLAVVSTGEEVYREVVSEGAVLTRVAKSHIRVGTFQYAAKYLPKNELHTFCMYVIDRHYPELKHTENPPLELLKIVQEKQIDLIVEWMRVGFIHGVMNTDNMSIACETIDYGPCAFMNSYSKTTVFSSIDRNSRYAYGNQPSIAQWNIACLASALLPIISEDKEKAIELCQEVINSFPENYERVWKKSMLSKLGIIQEETRDTALVDELLYWMEVRGVDYTNTFLFLADSSCIPDEVYREEEFQLWFKRWKDRISVYDWEQVLQQLTTYNPKYIPRNHLVEEALENAAYRNDYTLFSTLLEVVRQPYTNHPNSTMFQAPPKDGDLGYQTYCGT
jgi:uncharacterized protein YdiU (UPF0061 family)